MKKRQVLFFIESLQCGGAEKSLVSLLPLLNYDQMDVDLMVLQRGGLFEQYLPKQVNVIEFNTVKKPLLSRLSQLHFSLRLRLNKIFGIKEHGAETKWKTMHAAYRALEKEYDTAIAYQQGFPTYYIASKVSSGQKIAWINADITKVGYSARYNHPFYDLFNVIVPVSDSLYKILHNSDFVNKDKLQTVYDILNVDLIRHMACEQEIKGRGAEVLMLATVGRLVALKGYDIAIEAASILRDQGLPFQWYIIGEGPERPMLEEMIARYNLVDKVILVGEKANPYPYVNSCSIYVQSSRHEGFGLTIAEARILGRPIVSTNFSVVYDQITNEENGIIVEQNATALANGIIRIKTDDTLREKIVQNLQQERNTTAIVESEKVNQIILKNGIPS